jgi:hypothetical protein
LVSSRLAVPVQTLHCQRCEGDNPSRQVQAALFTFSSRSMTGRAPNAFLMISPTEAGPFAAYRRAVGGRFTPAGARSRAALSVAYRRLFKLPRASSVCRQTWPSSRLGHGVPQRTCEAVRVFVELDCAWGMNLDDEQDLTQVMRKVLDDMIDRLEHREVSPLKRLAL